MAQCKHPDGCPKKAECRGWCGMHYQRVRVHGDAGSAKPHKETIDYLDVFMGNTRRDVVTGCLLWKGYTAKGRPYFVVRGKRWLAHRWIFGEKFGYLPPVVRHKCDRPLCVDWERCLLPGTQVDNMRDMRERGRGINPPVHRGEKHPNAKLTDAQVQEIRTRYAQGGLTTYALGNIYGVSDVQIGNIVKGRQR